ncbi:MAG: hypothetical protein EXR72_13740 [Myxococcales bacterium]|nr:hypothetical protein [Myxococcales bacterium]
MRLALLLLLVAALPVSAVPAVSDCPTGAARKSYLAARKLIAAGDLLAAVERLVATRGECPAPAVDFRLAQAYERLGRLSLALDSLDKYLAAPGQVDNRVAVEAWAGELRARAEAERQGVPPPPLPTRAPPGPPPSYFPEETVEVKAPVPGPRQGPAEAERWRLFAGGGLAVNGALQPGRLAGRDGSVGQLGGSYQLGLAYRVALRARLDLAVMIAGQVLPWTQADAPLQRDVAFATVIGLGLRADLPLASGERTRLLLTPSTTAGLGSLSRGFDPSYENALGLRFGLALTVERSLIGVFIEPECFVLLAGDLRTPEWTVGVTAGVRVRL